MLKLKYIIIGIILLVFVLIPFSPIRSESVWQRKITNFERFHYKGGFQNWMVGQAESNWLYFANSNGLLEFDGVNWKTYSVRNNILRSVKPINKRIYVGGSSEFGYFMPEAFGNLVYHSLSANAREWGGEIWNIENNRGVIYFLGEKYVHLYNENNEGLITFRVEEKIDCSVIYKENLYIGTTDGIFLLNKNNKLDRIESSQTLEGDKIISLLPYKDDILVVTAKKGLYLFNEHELKRFESIADSFIQNNQLFSADIVGSKVALGSVQNGVFLFDTEVNSYFEEFNLSNGLKNNTVLNCFFDGDHNLWLGLDKGISYINLKSPIRPLFSTISPIGTGYASVKYNDEIYLATNQALYKLKANGRCEVIKDSQGQIWSLNVIGNTLFASGDNGILVISPNQTYKIKIQGAWETRQLKGRQNNLIVGTYSGFHVLKFENNKWTYSHKAPDFTDSCRGFMEDEDSYTFWTVNTNSKIQKVTYNKSLDKKLFQKEYDIPSTTFDTNVVFRKIDNNIVICSLNGIFMYSRITDSFDHYIQLESMLEGPQYYEYLNVDRFNNIWFVSNNNLKMKPFIENKYTSGLHFFGLSSELINGYENVYMLDEQTAIVSIDNAFAKINVSKNNYATPQIATHIREIVYSKTDSILSYGNNEKIIEIPYELNSIKINYSATNYEFSSDIRYSYRLKGVDSEWSIPSDNTEKEYTNLKEGKYIFEVISYIEGYPESSSTASISFTICPPWFRSYIAYLIYALILVSLVIVFYKKTISKQKKIIHQKGKELIIQSQRYEEESKQKDKEIYELQNENLKNELKYKTQELNGYILNVIGKNEILEDVKKRVLNISKAIDEEKDINIIKQRIMRLISQINSNIDNDADFKVFESNFDLIHQDFFKLLDESFTGLTRNDKILCAYLKMNLSSKEIAPLLNISVRGVEVNRYRLRKKMNLDRDINLSEYLNNLK